MVIFDTYADYWLKQHGIPSALQASISPYVQQNLNVLDLGCGGGRLAAALTQDFKYVWGIDVASELLRKAADKHPEINFICGDFLSPITWDGLVVDLIVSNCAIRKHDANRISTLCYEHLSPSGGIAFRVQSVDDLATVLPRSVRQATFYNKDELKESFHLFPQLSIKTERFRQTFSSATYLWQFLKRINIHSNGRIDLSPIRHYYIVTGRK